MRALVVCWLFFLQLRSFVGASSEFLICCLLVVFCCCWLLFLCVLAFFVVCWLFLCSVGASSELHRSFFLLFVGCFLLLLAVFCWFYVFCCLNVVFFGSVGASSDLYQSFCSSMFFLFARPITHNHPTPHTSHGVVVMGEFLRRGTSIVPPRRLAAPPRPRHRIRGGLRDTMPAGTSAFRSVNLHHTAAPTPSERAPTTSRDPLAQNKHT